ncbi:MAG: SLAC1 anion channel family protein [Spiribacter sp.]|jgi:tellurite resistance protein|nr:SLAC1 anion channel family protein [Spiribacter sp.]MDR9488953.1 SLAC1 anion channel family protein [Spiribacter sp.]
MPSTARLSHFPIAFFAMVMGLSGLTLVWQKAALVVNAPELIGYGLVCVTALVFSVFLLSYTVKLLRHTDAVRAELAHPVKLSFFPTISVSFILLGTALRHLLPTVAFGLWVIGSTLHLILTIFIINRWIHHQHFEVNHINPAWFIPAVGNILVAIAGVGFGYPSIGWFFFSIGVVFWLILLTIIFYRVFFHSPLPGRLLPTLFILIAPPAAGFIAYTELIGGLDAFARVQVNIALFFTLLLLTEIKRFAALEFFLSFWAYSFPLAAMTVAVLTYYQLAGIPWTLWVGVSLIGMTSLLIGWLVWLTARAALRGEICVADG